MSSTTPPAQKDSRPLYKQPTFYVVCVAFILFLYSQWPKNELDEYVSVIAESEYSIDFVKKPSLKKIDDQGLWLYRSSVSGVKFAVKFQEESNNITQTQLQEIALKSFDKINETYEYVVQQPTQYEQGYFWSLSNEKGLVRESLWVLAKDGWIEIISVYDTNKKGHEDLALTFTSTLTKNP